MPRLDTEEKRRQLIGYLMSRGPASARELLAHLRVSQPAVSRLIASVSDEILVVGKARATRYAARRRIPRVGDRVVIYEVDERGGSRECAVLHAQGSTGFFVEARVTEVEQAFHGDLPYFLDGMRPAGFLGRSVPKQHPELELPADVRMWSADQCLSYLTRFGWNLSGSFILGEEAFRLFLRNTESPPSLVARSDRAREYPRLAETALQGGTPGSSAVGEQPKFLTQRTPGPVDVLVKFSPRITDATTRRSADLLVCEHIAHEVLRDHGQGAASSELVVADGRMFLEVERFDRLPGGGRRGLISLLALDAQLLGRLQSWSDSAHALHARGLIDASIRDSIRWLELFGGLIANTDMHLGNLSLFMRGTRVTALAPAYDMLPMRYAPRDGHGTDMAFEPPLPSPADAPLFPGARRAAFDLWQRIASHESISPELQGVGRANAEKLDKMEGIERRLP